MRRSRVEKNTFSSGFSRGAGIGVGFVTGVVAMWWTVGLIMKMIRGW